MILFHNTSVQRSLRLSEMRFDVSKLEVDIEFHQDKIRILRDEIKQIQSRYDRLAKTMKRLEDGD